MLKPLKQKLFVDGLSYLLQEIYGLENKVMLIYILYRSVLDLVNTTIIVTYFIIIPNQCADEEEEEDDGNSQNGGYGKATTMSPYDDDDIGNDSKYEFYSDVILFFHFEYWAL